MYCTFHSFHHALGFRVRDNSFFLGYYIVAIGLSLIVYILSEMI